MQCNYQYKNIAKGLRTAFLSEYISIQDNTLSFSIQRTFLGCLSAILKKIFTKVLKVFITFFVVLEMDTANTQLSADVLLKTYSQTFFLRIPTKQLQWVLF